MRDAFTIVLVACVVVGAAAPAAGAATVTEGGTATAAPAPAASNNTTVTILSYNDIQTAAAKDGNLPRLATLIERRRAAHDNPTFVFGAGDELSPHALSPVSEWRAPVEVLNAMGADADTVGNHDLDYGTDGFADASAASEFPWVATNLVNETTGESIDGAERYEVVEKDGVRVGVLGVVHENVDSAVSADLATQNITVKPTVSTVKHYEQVLREQENVDAVVVLMHDSVPAAKELAGETSVDAVLTAHDEVVYGPEVVNGTVISEAKARAEYLSEINLTVRDGEVVAAEGRMLSTDGVPKDPEVSSIIEDYRAEVSLDSTVAYAETPLDARFASNYHRETGYGNLVTDAMRWETGADVAITNAGGIRSNQVYGPGTITGGDVFNTLPFANTVVVVELTGAELKEALASQVVPLESYVGGLFGAEVSQQVSGVRFEWVGHEGATKVRDVYVNRAGPGEEPQWVPLDDDETYAVAVNSYIAGGGSGYPLADEPRLQETGKLLATAVIDYLEHRGTVAPRPEGRMQRVDADVSDATIRTDGEGKVVLRFDAPADYNGTVPGTFHAATVDNRTVRAEQVVYDEDDGTLVVRFDDAKLASLVEGSDQVELDLYGGYHSTAHDRVYFPHSRLNADVTAEVVENGQGSSAGQNSSQGQRAPTPAVAVP
jgi:2',3'-cyclic-nucleotide 2'-phosphodiesterase (5'-nucleotidase family)